MSRKAHLRRVQKEEQEERRVEKEPLERRQSRNGSIGANGTSGRPASRRDSAAAESDEAVALLQSALVGHRKRNDFLRQHGPSRENYSYD